MILSIVVIVILTIAVITLWFKNQRLPQQFETWKRDASNALLQQQTDYKQEMSRQFDAWKAAYPLELTSSFAAIAQQTARADAATQLEQWKLAHTAEQRADAIRCSKSVNTGLIAEQFAPHLAGFNYNPKDAHFIGQPIDYIIFDGLHDGELKEVILLEVKTGNAKNNTRETQVKRAVDNLKVRYETFRPYGEDSHTHIR